MNILAQIIPGAREIRPPLAAGALIFLAALILFPDPKPKWAQGTAASRVVEVTDRAPLVAGVVGILFLAYIVGLIWCYVSDAIRPIRDLIGFTTKAVVPIALLALPLVTLGALISRIRGIGWLAIGAVTASAWYWTRETRPRPSPRGWVESGVRSIQTRAQFIVSLAYWWYLDRWNELMEIITPDRNYLQVLMIEEIERQIAATPGVLNEVVSALEADRLATFAYAANVNMDDIARYAPGHALLSASSDIRGVLRGLHRHPDLEEAMRAAILARLTEDADVRRVFFRSCINTKPLQKRMGVLADRTEVLLKAQKESLTLEYDRLLSEGELRWAVSFPVAAVVFSIFHSLGGDGLISKDARNWGYFSAWVVLWILALAAHNQFREAKRLLHICLRNRLVEVESGYRPPLGSLVVAAPVARATHAGRTSRFPWRRRKPWARAWDLPARHRPTLVSLDA